jgi:hypothetical protein
VLPTLAAFISYKLKYALSMCFATGAGVDNATKPSVCLNDQMVALFVPSFLGTGWALPDQFRANFTQAYRCQALSSVWDGWDGIFQLRFYFEHSFATFTHLAPS